MKDIEKIQRAIKFAVKTHEVYQKQTRKGKDTSYITHPLTVGLILSRIGKNDDLICAGILHDTIEDSIDEKKVTREMLEERFGEKVADLVLSVSETDKELSWIERKEMAKEHVQSFSPESVMLKSADVIANATEMLDDYKREGDNIFKMFNAPEPKKENIINDKIELINILINHYPENPLKDNLEKIKTEFTNINNLQK